jgi:hypothetical protein
MSLPAMLPVTNKKSRIIPEHIQLAVRNVEEISKIVGGVTIPKVVSFPTSTL